MNAQRRDRGMFKDDYDGPRLDGRVTAMEAEAFAAARGQLVSRLHTAMLTLSTLSGHNMGAASSWPSYVHEFSDIVGQEPDEHAPGPRFQPDRTHHADMLEALKLVDGVRPKYLKTVFFRAMGEWFDLLAKAQGEEPRQTWSWDTIGERLGYSGEWARGAYDSVMVQAARRSSLLEAVPSGHAVFMASVYHHGWRTYLSTAREPAQAFYDLNSKSPLELVEALAIWTPGEAAAKALIKDLRHEVQPFGIKGCWVQMGPEDLTMTCLRIARQRNIPWRQEAIGNPTGKRERAA